MGRGDPGAVGQGGEGVLEHHFGAGRTQSVRSLSVAFESDDIGFRYTKAVSMQLIGEDEYTVPGFRLSNYERPAVKRYSCPSEDVYCP